MVSTECVAKACHYITTDTHPKLSIDPMLTAVVGQLRNIHKLPYSACLEVFTCVANGFFNQKYTLGNIF